MRAIRPYKLKTQKKEQNYNTKIKLSYTMSKYFI